MSFDVADVFVAFRECAFLFIDAFRELFVCALLVAELSLCFVEGAVHAGVFVAVS